MQSSTARYTEEEILQIFKERHRLCSPLDLEADPEAEITSDMTIREWRDVNNLLGWKKLGYALNQEFRIVASEQEWYTALEPARAKSLRDVCALIAKYAIKDEYTPLRLFGQPCLKASIFLTLKKNLQERGADISSLSPSSSIERFFPSLLTEILRTGTSPIEKMTYAEEKRDSGTRLIYLPPTDTRS